MKDLVSPSAEDTMAMVLQQPVDDVLPCGPSLDYDPAHVSVTARLAPRSDVQYGAFIETPDAPDWAGIARDCELLLRRTRDITLLVGWCRARLALAKAAGLAHALGLMHAVLTRWPDSVHPQTCIDGVDDPMLRANAIAALADPDGLLGEIGDLVLLGNASARLTVRDVGRALATPRAAAAADPATVCRHLQQMRAGADVEAAAQFRALLQAATHAGAIAGWAREQLRDEAPSLERLLRLLVPFATPTPTPTPTSTPTSTSTSTSTPGPAPAPARMAPPASPPPFPMPLTPQAHPAPLARHEAAACIRTAREWFETHEPSSPVAVLLKQAERMVGQRFVQVADAIPLELLRQWDARPEAKTA